MQIDQHVRQKEETALILEIRKWKALCVLLMIVFIMVMIMTVAWLQLVLNINAHKTLGLSIRMSILAYRTRRGRTS
jgi:hypothetical protein